MSANDPLEASGGRPIIFFDGVCGLCNRFVDLTLRIDRNDTFRFAPLQGETANRMLPPMQDDPEKWSVIYFDEQGTHDQSSAVFRIFARMGGVYALLGLGRFLPRFLRDPAYRLIARNRYNWFGKRDACRLPAPEERDHFLP